MSLFIKSAASSSINKQRGFTLIELVIAMLIMGVVSVFSIKFITNSVSIYQQGKDREQLMSDIRFGIERLNREVRNAVPGSLRIEDIVGNEKPDTGACVRFWPIDTARRYTGNDPDTDITRSKVTIPARPDELDESGQRTDELEYYPNSWMIISPIGLDSSTQQCSEDAADPACAVKVSDEPQVDDKDLVFLVDKISSSIAKRVFFAKNQVRYCITPQQRLTRSETLIDSNFDSPVPMAEHISQGDFSKGSNEGEDADLYSQLTFNLTASNNNEHISFSHKIRLYNAP